MGKKSKRKPQQSRLETKARHEPRAKADLFLQKFQCLPFSEEDPWNAERINAFWLYVDVFETSKEVKRMIAASICYPSKRFYREEDLKVLLNVAHSKKEPVICRVRSFYVLGNFGVWSFDEFGQTLELFERALKLCKSAGRMDRQRDLLLQSQTVNVGDWLTGYQEQLNDIVSGKKTLGLSDKYAIRAWSPNFFDIDCGSLAGLRCDYCEKGREEFLKICAKCGMAHYCNSDCQESAWFEHGHKKVCRKPGKFKVGDIAVTYEAFGEQTKFGGHVKIIKARPMEGSTKKDPSHWVVQSRSFDGDIGTVRTERLSLLRQSQWNRLTSTDCSEIAEMCRARDEVLATMSDREEEEDDDDDENNALPELASRDSIDHGGQEFEKA